MDEGERDDVIRVLLLEAGMIAEGQATELAFTLPTDAPTRAAKLTDLVKEGEDSVALLRAAQILNDRAGAEP